VDLGPKMATLLSRLSNQKIALSYVEQLLAAFKDEEIGRAQATSDSLTVDPLSLINKSLDEPLTKREFEILSLLEQRLRNKEIAEQLFISVETVKRHNINIYGKLNVNSRLEAIDRANALRKPKG
jgi:LuxR family maltose regulon positive regulatory protein